MPTYQAPEPIRITIDAAELEPSGPDPEDVRSRLMGTIVINGVYHHLELIAVENVRAVGRGVVNGSVQGPADPAFEAIFDAFRPDGHYQTLEIEGREYAAFLSPFC